MFETIFFNKWIRPLFISNIESQIKTTKKWRIFIVLYLFSFLLFLIILTSYIITLTIENIKYNGFYIFSYIIILLWYWIFRIIIGGLLFLGLNIVTYIKNWKSNQSYNVSINKGFKTEVSTLIYSLLIISFSISLIIILNGILIYKFWPNKTSTINTTENKRQTMRNRIWISKEQREQSHSNNQK